VASTAIATASNPKNLDFAVENTVALLHHSLLSEFMVATGNGVCRFAIEA